MTGAIVELELDLSTRIQFDGTNWHVWIDGRKIGPNRTKVEANDHLRWLNEGGLQDILGIVPDIIERAFTEKEQRNNGK
jgi:hypothetical protein